MRLRAQALVTWNWCFYALSGAAGCTFLLHAWSFLRCSEEWVRLHLEVFQNTFGISFLAWASLLCTALLLKP